MSKPILDIEIRTPDDRVSKVKALFDSGSFLTVVREDKVPSSRSIVRRKTPMGLRGAAKGSKLTATGDVNLILVIGTHEIHIGALVSRDIAQEMIVGAGAMQMWDISIVNRNGHTDVTVGRDMNDPEITEVV